MTNAGNSPKEVGHIEQIGKCSGGDETEGDCIPEEFSDYFSPVKGCNGKGEAIHGVWPPIFEDQTCHEVDGVGEEEATEGHSERIDEPD